MHIYILINIYNLFLGIGFLILPIILQVSRQCCSSLQLSATFSSLLFAEVWMKPQTGFTKICSLVWEASLSSVQLILHLNKSRLINLVTEPLGAISECVSMVTINNTWQGRKQFWSEHWWREIAAVHSGKLESANVGNHLFSTYEGMCEFWKLFGLETLFWNWLCHRL